MKKIFVVAIVFLFFLVASSASAIGRLPNSDEILAEMYANPSNFIRYSGASTGLSFLIAKSSLNVEYYSPPTYIISVRKMTHFNRGTNDNYEAILEDSIIRYKYDIVSKKMYVEAQGDSGEGYWKYLDPSKQEVSNLIKSGEFEQKTYDLISAGEFLFYFAYKTIFYGNPSSGSFKEFLDKGITRMPLRKLDNGGDPTIWHFYNHKTGKIECWKNVTNSQSKKMELVRVR